MIVCFDTPTCFGMHKRLCAQGKDLSAVVPLRHKLLRLPLSVRDAVREEIHRLLELGIIERVDALLWVSPIVVIQKKSGAIRMCVALRFFF